ncbi:phage tail protein [Vibrio sp. C8]
MDWKSRNQIFDIDLEELEAIQNELSATKQEMLKAYNRALRRTAVTIKSISSKLAKETIQAKQLKYIRKRIKDYLVNENNEDLKSLRFWFGLDDMSVHTLKGSLRQNKIGAIFTPKSSQLARQQSGRGFVLTGGKIGNQRIMFTRFGQQKGKYRVMRVPIADSMKTKIEQEVYSQITKIFLNHFSTDLKGRVAMRKQ